MTFFHLVHDTRLRLVHPSQSLEESILQLSGGSDLLSFRQGSKEFENVSINACSRVNWIGQRDVVLCHIEQDSPLAPLIIWDVAHSLEIGRLLTFVSHSAGSYLDRDYFSDSFKKISDTPLVYKKMSKLRAEVGSDLDSWTFGIPVGGGDATLLNVVVRRILDLNIRNVEIILCGLPGDGFAFLPEVRIVGQDIPFPPLRISQKKNVIVSNATHDNLCILHDRVLLPLNFREAVEKFGLNFPIVSFQSLYFEDYNHLVPARYSDYFAMEREIDSLPKAPIGRIDSLKLSAHSQAISAIAEGYGYLLGNPLRYKAESNFNSGSMYIVKRPVWEFCAQDPSFHWAEMEDVEFGLRASKMGIPSRINPHTLTESLISRPLLIGPGGLVGVQGADGKAQRARFSLQGLPVKRKPILSVSARQANESFGKFSKKYRSLDIISFTDDSTLSDYITEFIAQVSSAQVAPTKEGVINFYDDMVKLLGFRQGIHGEKSFILREYYVSGVLARLYLFKHSETLKNLASRAGFGRIFAPSLDDFVPRTSAVTWVCVVLSSFLLSIQNGRIIYLEGGFKTYYQALRSLIGRTK